MDAGMTCTKDCCIRLLLLLLTLLTTVDTREVSKDTSDPRIVEHPEDQYVVRNEPATLNCKAEGQPPPVITWYRYGLPVITANDNPTSHRMLLPSGQLFFLRVQHSSRNQTDLGVYYCNATNPQTGVSAVSNEASVELAVMRDEFREHPPHSLDVPRGGESVIPCRPPRGKPDPRVRWMKDGDPVQTSSRISVEDSGTLRIRATDRDDMGVYVCVAHNTAGEKESIPCQLTVKERPRIIEGPKDVTVQEATDVLFRCQSNPDPDVTVIWKKQNGQIPPGRSRILEDRSLKIERADLSDEGVYVCRVENSVGYQESEAKLSVHTQPSFVVTPQDKVVGVGRRVSLRCQVTGNPVPAVFWNKESSQQLMFPNYDHGRFSVIDDGTLVIESVRKEDAGEYVCKGLSIAGSAYAKARLEVRDDDPRPPPIIHQGPQNQTLPVDSLALLPCLATGNPAPSIRWYKNYKELQMRDPRFALLDSGTLQIADLRKSDTGIYTCRAVSETGETARGAALIVETPTNPAVIFHRTPETSTFPGSPSKPSVTDVTDSSVVLSWRSSSTHGASPVFAYTVEYFSHDTGEGWVVASDSVRQSSYTVTGLLPDTSYMFLVRAQNSHGLSLPSPVTSAVRTRGSGGGGKWGRRSDPMFIGDRLRNTQLLRIINEPQPINSTAVLVTWQLRRIPAHYVDGYQVRYRVLPDYDQSFQVMEDDTSFLEDTVLGGSVMTHVIVGLEKYMLYEIFVQPFFRNVVGQQSNVVRVRTAQDVPSAPPKNIHFKMMGNTTVMLIWEPPPKNHRHGPLLGYRIYIFHNESGFYQRLSANASDTSIVIDNIAKDVTYRSRIQAYNHAGDGVLSDIVFIGPDAMSRMQFGMVQQPWFIGTVIGTVGGALWFALCVFSLWLCRRRQRRRKYPRSNGVVSIPVRKTDDPARLGYLINPKDMQRRPLPGTVHSQQFHQPDVTRLTSSSKTDMFDGSRASDPPSYPAAGATAYHPGTSHHAAGAGLIQQFSPSSDSIFRPINQAYMIQSSPHQQAAGSYLGSRDRNIGSDAAYNRATSPPGQFKQPLLYLPPPPQHPPPSSGAAGTPSRRHLSTDTCEDDDIYSRIPASSSDGGETYPPSLPLVDYYAGHSSGYDVVDSGSYNDGLEDSLPPRRPPKAPTSKVLASPQLQRRVCDQVRSYSPRAASEPEPCSPTPPQFRVPPRCIAGDRRVPYSDGEYSLAHGRTVSPPPPAPPGMTETMMDRAMQSSLPSLVGDALNDIDVGAGDLVVYGGSESPTSELNGLPGDYSGLSELGGYSMGRPDSEELSELGQRDCQSPVSSIDEIERAVADSVLASWADAIDNAPEDGADMNSALVDSDVSSENALSDSSDPEAAFLADADFAVAVARAAELSGMTVVGSTIVDPNIREKVKRPVKRRQRAPRPASPYSTDSNYSAILAATPHKPYPKSERRRQLVSGRQGRHHGRHGNAGNAAMSPALRPLPPIANSGNEDVISTDVQQQQQQPLIGRYPGTRDSERSHRTNPLDAFDTRDTPIV